MIVTFQFRKFRPAVRPKEAPGEWFRYASENVSSIIPCNILVVKAHLYDIHEKNLKRSWKYVFDLLKLREEYIFLFRKHLSQVKVRKLFLICIDFCNTRWKKQSKQE